MEKSAIIHYMNESYAYKISEHCYLIRIRTKKDDFNQVTLKYVEKYLRERRVKDHPTFSIEMRKVASTSIYDYYEAIISDEMDFFGRNFSMIAARYYFVLDDGASKVYYGNYKFFEKEPYESIEMFNLVFHQADRSFFKTPEWSKGAIIYQIFPERFSPTDGKYCQTWNEIPMGVRTRTNGTLRGIIQKIDYIKDLGVDAIYLNPIFKSNSSHRYDTIDYMAIDPLLGTDEDFRELVDTCHNNGIKVILDLVFNHSSTQFFAFQDLLKNQEKSKYVDWYFVSSFPVAINFPPNYKGFSFGPYMPKLNTENPDCREYFLDVTKHYLRDFNVDGYRLDVADEVTHDFWRVFRKESKKYNKDALIMGEVWYESTPYLRGDEFDSIMNYTIYDGIRNFLKGKLSLNQFIDIIERERGETPLTYYHNSNILIGSHDTDRIYTFLDNDKNKFLQAVSLLLFLPGSPLIYYGDEIMMEGSYDPDCRRGMIFDKHNEDVLNYVKKLIKIKHLPVVKYGDIHVEKINSSGLKITRFIDENQINMIINFNNEIYLDELKGKFDLINEKELNGIVKENQIIIYK